MNPVVPHSMSQPVRYRIGIDVGLRSIGFSAVQVDDDDQPTKLLNSLVVIHDAGVDPQHAKAAESRLAVSGVARRTRRLVRRRRRRLLEVDKLLADLGWDGPVDPHDGYFPWTARTRLASAAVLEPVERNAYLGAAVRHIARHRGWRNPWIRAEVLRKPAPPSERFIQFRERVEAAIGRSVPADATVGQLVAASAMTKDRRLRGDGGLLGTTLAQSDNANELLRIAEVQQIPRETIERVIDTVFAAESPRGSHQARVGRDALPGQGALPRAPKATDAFQRYRTVSIVANLRVKDGSKDGRRLSAEEMQSASQFLLSRKPSADTSWTDVAEHLGLRRTQLTGHAKPTADGERAASRPPVHATTASIVGAKSKVRELTEWWGGASGEARDALIELLADGVERDDSVGAVAASELIRSLDDETLAKLDALHLPPGRAAYSIDSLRRLTDAMLEGGLDVYEARQRVFGVSNDWVPPVDAIGDPVGNPAVDRVVKQVNAGSWQPNAVGAHRFPSTSSTFARG